MFMRSRFLGVLMAPVVSVLAGFALPILDWALISPSLPAASAAPVVGNCQGSVTNVDPQICPDCVIYYETAIMDGIDCEPCSYTFSVTFDCTSGEAGTGGSGNIPCGGTASRTARCPGTSNPAITFEYECSECP